MNQESNQSRTAKSMEFFARAGKVIPGGIYGHISPLMSIPGHFPYYTDRAKGCHYWDVDGNEYIDYMCSFGAVGMGYNHPAIEEAYRKQVEKSNCTSLPSYQWVETAKFLVGEIPYMDWVLYGKNGSDVTTCAAMVSRIHTERHGIAMGEHCYHGLHNWCIESGVGIPPAYQSHVYKFEYNNLESLKALVEKEKGKLAAVFLIPLGHHALKDQEEPNPGFYEGVRELCDREGMLMVIDDVRAGFRVHYEGTHRHYTKVNPDLICYGKTISNGYPLAVLMGTQAVMESAQKVYWSGTHFYSAGPMAAAQACMKEMKAAGSIEHIYNLGVRLTEGLREQAQLHELDVRVTGHPALPYMVFDDDAALERMRQFCGEAAKRGLFFHPHHNWFISAALTDEDIDKTLDATDQCFKVVAEGMG